MNKSKHQIKTELKKYKTISGMLGYLEKNFKTGESLGIIQRNLIADQLSKAVISLRLEPVKKEESKKEEAKK